MKRRFLKIIGLFLAQTIIMTSVDVKALASESEPLLPAEDILVEESGEELSEQITEEPGEELEDGSLEEPADEQGQEGVFGFYETIMNEGEGDEPVISIIRQGDLSGPASVIFKAVDVSAEYGKDYTLSLERKLLPDKTLTGSGERPLVEQYGEVTSEEITDEPLISNDHQNITGDGNSLADIYAIQTGKEAPRNSWREFSGDKVPVEDEEITGVMQSGWDNSREALWSLPGVTTRLDFAPGEDKKEIKVKIKDDEKSESDEVMVYVLQDAEGAGIGDAYNGYLNISDNDSAEKITYALKEKALTVTPDQDRARVTVIRNSGIDQMSFVSVGTRALDAVADEDYEKTCKELFFAPGVTEVSVEVPVTGKRDRESRFYIGLRDAGGTVYEDGACLVTIEKDSEDPKILNDTYTDNEEISNDKDATTENRKVEKNVYSGSNERIFMSKAVSHIDFRGADYVKIEVELWPNDYGYSGCSIIVVDSASKKDLAVGGCSLLPNSFTGNKSVEERTITFNRGNNQNWAYSDVEIWFFNDIHTFQNTLGYTKLKSIVLGYNSYDLKIKSNYDDMGVYREKIYTGEEEYTTGKLIQYPKPYFTDDSGARSDRISAFFGDTVKTSIWEGGGQNSQGVKADSTNLKFLGFKLAKPGSDNTLSGFISSSESFTFDQSFVAKYSDYMSSDRTFELVPVYEPLPETVEFDNSNASVDGKEDVKGLYSGFSSGYKLKATMLDSINVSAKANNDYKISHIVLQKPNGAMHYISRPNIRWTRWATMSDNQSSDDKTTLASPINFNGAMFTDEEKTHVHYQNYCKVLIYYDTNVSSITLAPSPQHMDKETKDCKIVYVKGAKGNDSILMKPKPAGETLELKNTLTGKPYIFGAMPVADYHAYWKDGTLDSNGDGQDDIMLPGYTPFANTFGNQFMYIQNIPLNSKIYYNFVKDVSVSEDIKPLPLRGHLSLSDKLLLSGKAVKYDLAGVDVSAGGQNTVTKEDGYYELASNQKFSFYDLYQYNVTFTGDSIAGPIGVMYSQNPKSLGDVIIDAAKEVDITDVMLYTLQNKKDGSGMEYALVDTSGTRDGYYLMCGGNHNYRLIMRAERRGQNLTEGVLKFSGTDGSTVTVEGSEDATHNGVFTFDFNPKNKGIKPGATARVTFYTGDQELISRDTGIKMTEDAGTLRIVNTLARGNSGTDSISHLTDVSEDDPTGLIGPVGQFLNIEWNGEFDTGSDPAADIYIDGSDRVISVGFNREILSATGEKDALMEAAREAAAVYEDEDKAKRARNNFYNFIKDIESPKKDTAMFTDSLPMDLGYSFLMTFSFDSAKGSWYFKDMILSTALDSSSSATMDYVTPIGAAVGVGMKLDTDGKAIFVVEERKDLNDPEDKEKNRYYITESNSDSFNVLEAAGEGDDRRFDRSGSLRITPAITLTGSSGIAGDLVNIDINGRAEYDMAYGAESAGTCSLSASIKVSALGYSSNHELANKTISVDEIDPDGALNALLGDSSTCLNESIDTMQAEDLSYLETDTSWQDPADGFLQVEADGSMAESLAAVDEGGEDLYSERRLAGKIASDADFDMVTLGGGRSAMVFLNVPKERIKDKDNAKAVYYTFCENGVWNDPVLIEDDGTLDLYPHIYPTDKGALIVWSSVNEKYKDVDDRIKRQNALDLHGIFINSDGSFEGDIMEITRTTEDEEGAQAGIQISDFASDRAFGMITDTDRLILCYEKRQYAADDTNITIGDMLYPVSSVMVSRTYDLTTGSWVEGSETVDSLAGIAEYGENAQEIADTYNLNVYGQKFHDYLPEVMLHEDLDETGSYREGAAEPVTALKLADPGKGVLYESDAATLTIDGKKTGLVAYTVDTDGNPATLYDRELYLSTCDPETGEFAEPIILTGYCVNSETNETVRPENKNPRFVSTQKGLYLTWLMGGHIKALDISHLIKNEDVLVKYGDLGGVIYRYVDKTAAPVDPDDSALYYYPPFTVVNEKDIRFFDTETDGQDIYFLWTESSANKPEELQDNLNDIQMWCVRITNSADGLKDTTNPVQITSHYGVKYDDVAFGIENGTLAGVARKVPSRKITASEAMQIHKDSYDAKTFVPYSIWDDTGAYPVAFRMDLRGMASIKNAGFLQVKAGTDAGFSFVVLNDGIGELNGADVTARDSNGNSVLYEYTAGDEDSEGTFNRVDKITVNNLKGGGTTVFNCLVPVGEDQNEVSVTIKVTEADGTVLTKTVSEELRPDISVTDIGISPTGIRNLYQINGMVTNRGKTRAGKGLITLKTKTDERERKLSSIEYPMLLPGETYEIDEFIEVTDDDFSRNTDTEKDKETAAAEYLCLYAEYTGDLGTFKLPVLEAVYHSDADTDRGFISRTASVEELSDLNYVKGVKVDAVKEVLDENGVLTGGEIVDSGSGQLILERGETVDIRATILTDSPRRGAQAAADADGNIVDLATGTEGLTWCYEFIGDAAATDSNGMLRAVKEGTGKLRIHVYPDNRGFITDNSAADNIEDTDFSQMSEGEEVDAYYKYPSDAIKTYVLNVDIVDKGERKDMVSFRDSKGIIYRIIGESEVTVCSLADGIRLKSLTIPATVKKDRQTYKVTRIDANAFGSDPVLQSVSIGKYVKTIGERAFAECRALKTVNLPAKLEGIEAEAFMNCTALKSISIPASLISLGDRAFYGCSSLKRILIKAEGLTADNLGNDVFSGVPGDADYAFTMKNAAVRDMLNRTLTEEAEEFTDKKGIRYRILSEGERTLIAAGLSDTAELKIKSLSIPASVTYKGYKYKVTEIDQGAFEGNALLTWVSIPNTVVNIGDRAFCSCISLRSAVIPKSVKKIGVLAFGSCVKLNTVTFKSADITISKGAFAGVPDTAGFKYSFSKKESDAKLRIPLLSEKDNFTDKKGFKYEIIDPEAYAVVLTGIDKEGITNISVPNTVDYRGVRLRVVAVDDGAFSYNRTIKKVVLGNNVSLIAPDAFAGCTSLTSVNLKNVMTIDFSAFMGCTSLRSVTFPTTLLEIGNSAFKNCSSLKSVTVKSNVLSEVGMDAFDGIKEDAVIKLSVKKDNKEAVRNLLTESGVDPERIK